MSPLLVVRTARGTAERDLLLSTFARRRQCGTITRTTVNTVHRHLPTIISCGIFSLGTDDDEDDDTLTGVEMSVYPILLHTGACLWYVFFWNNFLTNGSGQKESDWDPKYRDIHEMGTRYLTNWNLAIQTLFFGGCLFHDLMKILNGPNWLKLGSKFQTILSLSFSSILLPLGIFVCVSFWVMYTYDREIVYPKVVDSYIPFWQNHGMHTIILPLTLAELFTTRHNFPSVTASLVILLGLAICYAVVFLGTYAEKGRWVYPLFDLFSLPISLGIMIVFLFIILSFLFVGIFIQNMYWGKEEKKRYRKPLKKSS